MNEIGSDTRDGESVAARARGRRPGVVAVAAAAPRHAPAPPRAGLGPVRGRGWEERIMDEPVTDRLHEKQGRSIGRRVFDARSRHSSSVYLKRHYRLPWWHGVLADAVPEQRVVAGVAGVAAPRLGARRRASRCRGRSRPGSSSGRGSGCRASSRSRNCTACCRCTRRFRSPPQRLDAGGVRAVEARADRPNSRGSRANCTAAGCSTKTCTSATSTSRNRSRERRRDRG